LREGVKNARKDFEKRTMVDISGNKDRMERSSEMSKAIGREEALLKAIGSVAERRQDTLDAVRSLGGKSKDLEQAEKTVSNAMAAIKSGRDLSKTEVDNLNKATKIIQETKALSTNSFDLARKELGTIRKERKEALNKYESAIKGVLSDIDSRSKLINDSKKERDEELKVLRSMRGVGGVAGASRATTDALREATSAQASLGNDRDNFSRIINATQRRDLSTEELKLLTKATEQIKRSDEASKNALAKLNEERKSISEAKGQAVRENAAATKIQGVLRVGVAKGLTNKLREEANKSAMESLGSIDQVRRDVANLSKSFGKGADELSGYLSQKDRDQLAENRRSILANLGSLSNQFENNKTRFEALTNKQKNEELSVREKSELGELRQSIKKSDVDYKSALQVLKGQNNAINERISEQINEREKASTKIQGALRSHIARGALNELRANERTREGLSSISEAQKEAIGFSRLLDKSTEKLGKYLSEEGRAQLVEKNREIVTKLSNIDEQLNKNRVRFNELSDKGKTLSKVERGELGKLRENISESSKAYNATLGQLKVQSQDINEQARKQESASKIQGALRSYATKAAESREAANERTRGGLSSIAEGQKEAIGFSKLLDKSTNRLGKYLSEDGKAQLVEKNKEIVTKLSNIDVQLSKDRNRFNELSGKGKTLSKVERGELGKLRENISESSKAYNEALGQLKTQSQNINEQARKQESASKIQGALRSYATKAAESREVPEEVKKLQQERDAAKRDVEEAKRREDNAKRSLEGVSNAQARQVLKDAAQVREFVENEYKQKEGELLRAQQKAQLGKEPLKNQSENVAKESLRASSGATASPRGSILDSVPRTASLGLHKKLFDPTRPVDVKLPKVPLLKDSEAAPSTKEIERQNALEAGAKATPEAKEQLVALRAEKVAKENAATKIQGAFQDRAAISEAKEQLVA